MIHSTTPLNKITADEGKVLTNGKVYLREVCLSKNSSVADWHEITEEEYVKTTTLVHDVNISS